MLNGFKGLSTNSLTSSFTTITPQNVNTQSGFKLNPLSFAPVRESHSALVEEVNLNRRIDQTNSDHNESTSGLKATTSEPLVIKMLKTESNSAFEANNEKQNSIMDKTSNHNEDEDDGSDSDDDLSKKRGKYKTYSEPEKAHIITFMAKHGIQKTLELFSGGEHKITKRKLKSWLDNQDKIKGVKGRKSNDPARDQCLHGWCISFQEEHGRPPSRKETTKQALKLSGDPNFQASKGWLDKFSRKFGIEFTPLKIVPPRNRKKVKTDSDDNSISATPNTEEPSGDLHSSSNIKEHTEIDNHKSDSVTTNEGSNQDGENNTKVGLPQSTGFKQLKQQPQSQKKALVQPRLTGLPQLPKANLEESLTSLDANIYQALAALNMAQPQSLSYPYAFPFEYGMPYPMNFPTLNNLLNSQPSCPSNNPFNLLSNLQPNLAENLMRLQQMMMKDNNLNSQKP